MANLADLGPAGGGRSQRTVCTMRTGQLAAHSGEGCPRTLMGPTQPGKAKSAPGQRRADLLAPRTRPASNIFRLAPRTQGVPPQCRCSSYLADHELTRSCFSLRCRLLGGGAMLVADSMVACSAIRCAATAATSGGVGFIRWCDQGTTPERLAALAASQASTTRVRGLHARRPRRAAVVYTSGTA